jgi:hypothetical protein
MGQKIFFKIFLEKKVDNFIIDDSVIYAIDYIGKCKKI